MEGSKEPEVKVKNDPLKTELDFAKVQFDTYSMLAEGMGPHKIADVSKSKAKLQKRINDLEGKIARRDSELTSDTEKSIREE